MRPLALVALALLLAGCAGRSHTAQLWRHAGEFTIVEERYLDPSQRAQLLAVQGENVHYDGVSRFYVRQSLAERAMKTPLIAIATPFTVVVDGLGLVVTTVLAPGQVSTGSAGGNGDARVLGELVRLAVESAARH